MVKLARTVSPTETEYLLQLSDGSEFDVVLEINYDKHCGYFYNSALFKPKSLVRVYPSQLALDLQIELGVLTEQAFSHYTTNYLNVLENHFFKRAI